MTPFLQHSRGLWKRKTTEDADWPHLKKTGLLIGQSQKLQYTGQNLTFSDPRAPDSMTSVDPATCIVPESAKKEKCRMVLEAL